MRILIQTCLHLGNEALPLEQTYKLPHLLERHPQLIDIGSVRFEGEGQLTSGIFTVTGQVTGEYTLTCSRCLADLSTSFHTDFEARFRVEESLLTASSSTEEEEIYEVEGNQIDLLPHIEETVLLSIPFAPVCQSEQECQNNLPQQGKDWALVTDSKEQKIDPRLAKLKTFFDN